MIDLERSIRVNSVTVENGKYLVEVEPLSHDADPDHAQHYAKLVQSAPEMLRLLRWITCAMETSSIKLPGNHEGCAFIADRNALVPLQTLLAELELNASLV